MAVIVEEDFEVSPDNTTLTTSNTAASLYTGTAVSDSTVAAVEGTYSMLCAATGAVVQARFDWTNDTDTYYRFYLRLNALPGANLAIASWFTSAAVATSDLRVTTTGTLQLRNQALTAVDTSTTTLTTGAWHRIEIHHTTTAISGRIFKDPNYHSTTADEDEAAWTGATTAASGVGRVVIGVNAAVTQTLWIDGFVADDTTWVGPASVAAAPTRKLRVVASPQRW